MKLKSFEVEDRLTQYIVSNGGWERRKYLGMSQIHRAEDELVRDMLQGSPVPEVKNGLVFALGYDFEKIMLAKLERAGVLIGQSGRSIVSKFDGRFRGHTDGELIDGCLCEIKSTIEEKLQRIEAEKRVPNAHYVQAQMYMCHGGYDRDMIVYVSRDTGRIVVRSLRYDLKTANTYNEKAKRILEKYDKMLIR